MWHFGDGMGWWMFSGGAWMFVLSAVVIGLIVWAVITLSRRNGLRERDGALRIARERYARGEISREEFEQVNRDLS